MHARDRDVDIRPLAAAELPGVRGVLGGVYAAAFSEPPYREPPQVAERFGASLAAHAARPDFRMRVAKVPDGAIVGFAYGYASAPGQWWHDRVAASIGPEPAARWLVGGFEVVELAVRPDRQRAGIGGGLLDALLAGLLQPTAILSTLDAETPARRLYRRRGWRVVGHLPSPTLGRFLVMARDLPPVDAVRSAP